MHTGPWIRRATAIAAAVLLIGSLSAVTVRGAGEPVKNPGTFVELQFGDVSSLDPDLAYDIYSAEPIWPNVYETLIMYSGSSLDKFQPMLATEVPSLANHLISPDGLTYTFPIRTGVHFHDGSVMTPDDVVYSIRRFLLQDQAGGPAWLLLSPLVGVDSTRDAKGKIQVTFADVARAVSAKGDDVVIHLKKPFAPFLTIIAAWAGVMPRAWAAAHGDWDGSPGTWQKYNNPKTEDRYAFEHMDGTGPFKLDHWDRQAKEVFLVRNDSYWRTPAALQRVVIQSVAEFTARRLQLQQGDADLVVASLNQENQLRGLPGTVIQDNLPQIAVQTLQFNFKINTEANPDAGSGRLDGAGIPPDFFADLHVRRGFAYAFDYAANLNGAYAGKGVLPHGPIVQGLLGFDPTVPVYTTSREKAVAEFKEAMGGKVWDTGFKFTIPYTAGNTARQVGAQIVKDALEALNPKFQIAFRPVPSSTLNDLLFSHKGTMYFLGWFADYPDPHDFAQPFLSANGYFPVRGGYRNPEADRLIDQAVGTADPAKRNALYKQLSLIAYNDLPYLFLVQPVTYYAMRSWVHGWYYNPIFPGQYFYTISKR
ncbi:MAG TPA: ABC transporter substrate-binding protein [bacterium]|nr:ABC transporter substrate-binding protein [bacterium]